MFGKDKNKRFITTTISKNFGESFQVIVDLETGVNYLEINKGYGVGLSPLLDSEGKVVISSAAELRKLKNRD